MMKYFVILAILFPTVFLSSEEIIIDSNMDLNEALKGTAAPKEIIESLKIINVEYFSFDKKLHRGQLVLHKEVENVIKEAFEIMKKEKFPIAKCIPIVKYNWDDDASMSDNNTSMFNYRKIAGKSTLSNHSYGIAIDINPFQNPAVYSSGKISPSGANYDIKAKGTILTNSKVTDFFKSKGWRWGGDWTSLKDYQHFDSAK